MGRQGRNRHARRRIGSGAWLALPLTLAYAAALGWAVVTKRWPWWVLPAAFGVSLLAFFAYRQDKHAAQRGRRRTPENTLHLWSLAGGWPGAWVAQQVLRHKSSKPGFLAAFWATAVLHCAAVGYWLAR
ncbi:DUF1294 domain-containing protein [Ramlibacter humi]|uniref:DUF1294 domain-containing protein n=1 Tax=Ramlibacter humi TaxID=2530451 RepID=A0A4Z0CBC5_9BURK|nr:DUF1294 domain-containing protein [Ramlibacter humi]TFZ08903.1 DUF1294 domain-containing protein [Ramlibacter humi]